MKFLRLYPYLPAFLLAVVIFILSTKATIQLPESAFSLDKIGHFVAYALLAWLFIRGLRKSERLTNTNLFSVILIVSIYGAALEFVQWFFFPGRFFEVWDMIANITGASFSGIITLCFSQSEED